MRIVKSCFILLIIFHISCAVQNKSDEYIRVYKQNAIGDVGSPIYLILTTVDMDFELYPPLSHFSELGYYKISNDTLCLLKSRYSYAAHKINQVDTTEVSFSTIPIYLLIKKNKLIDVTDYYKYPELAPWAKKGGIYDGFYRIK